MKKIWAILFVLVFMLPFILGVDECSDESAKAAKKEAAKVNQQDEQYAKSQPIPFFDWSLERDLVTQLYRIRNQKVATHAVWRSDYGMIEGDCPSMGFGIPYDTSLTNPVKVVKMIDYDIVEDRWKEYGMEVIEQAEPNGIYASKNTSATWVMCIGDAGIIEPVYIESKVTIYPGPVKVDYDKNRVTRTGAATARIKK